MVGRDENYGILLFYGFFWMGKVLGVSVELGR